MYEMIIHVDTADDMALIIQACKGTAKLVKAEEVKGEKIKRRSRARPTEPIKSPISGQDLARKLFADGKAHKSPEIRQFFTSHGFAPNSASPAISFLATKSHELKKLADGEYIMTAKLRQVVNSGAPAE